MPPLNSALYLQQSPDVHTVTHTTATNVFPLAQKGKILESFSFLVSMAKQHLNW